MKLYRKLLIFTLAATVLPLSAVGFSVLRGAERALSARIAAQQLATAQATAEAVGRELGELLDAVSGTVENWDVKSLSDAELRALLLVLHRRSERIDAVVMVDVQGRQLVEPVTAGPEAGGEGRPAVTAEGLEKFHQVLPREQALQVSQALVLSPPYLGPEGRAQLALALPVEARGGGNWVLGILASLEAIRARVGAAAGTAGVAMVLDERARVVAGSGAPPGTELARPDSEAATRLRARGGGTATYLDEGGLPLLAAFAPVGGGAEWGVMVRLTQAEAFAEVSRMRRTVLWWTAASLLGFLALGWIFIKGVTGGLARIDGAARRFAAGDLSVRLPVAGGDEVAQVSRTFNLVGEELGAARTRLERWNEELQAEVEARTRELKEAQAQLLEAQKLAAIGQLGAGVAHEINNPLAGILGYSQLLLMGHKPEDKNYPILKKIEEAAKRCREITVNLLRFSQQRQEAALENADLNDVVKEAILVAEGQLHEVGVTLVLELAGEAALVRGDRGHLAQVLLNLLSNAGIACKGRSQPRVVVATRVSEGEVRLEVRDTGKGIAPDILPRIFEPFFTTKDVWTNVGLGLSVSYRIVSEHGGRIAVETEVGSGSIFTVHLPRASAQAVAEAPLAAVPAGPVADSGPKIPIR
jgi:signal transduction histidine kinase